MYGKDLHILNIKYLTNLPMKKETLEISEDQYEALLKLIYLGKWMYDSHKTTPDRKADKIEQMVFSLATKFGLSELIEYDNKTKLYFPTRILEGQIHLLVDDYEDFVFWDELVHRFARRDFEEKYGEEIISKMDIRQKLKHEQVFNNKYGKEFEKNGIDNLVLKKH